jgi:hypothetical protein
MAAGQGLYGHVSNDAVCGNQRFLEIRIVRLSPTKAASESWTRHAIQQNFRDPFRRLAVPEIGNPSL